MVGIKAMYELIRLTEHDYYIESPAKIGLVLIGDNEAVLIDSGSDKDAGKKAYRILEANGWKLKAIYNTHSHADHIGGNHFLQEKTGCSIYAAGLERVYTNTPFLEPVGLYGGLPFRELRHKFLMAQESCAIELTDDVMPDGMKILRLPGHSFDMTGFLTADGTAYIADSVSSAETLMKYGLGYLWDAQAALATLEYLKTVEAERFVPSHAEVTENISRLAELNSQAITAAENKILELCAEPVTFEKLLTSVFDAYSLQMTAQQYALIGSTVRSYLSSLYTQEKITFIFENNKMLWKTV